MGMKVYKNILSNKVRTILTVRPQTDIVAIKIFIKVGSINDGNIYGITHFLEHILFGSSEVYKDVFYEMERYGGVINANTTREYLTLYTVIGQKNVYKVLPLILKLIFDFKPTEDDIEKEKKIILQEIMIYQNSSDAMWDLFALNYWQHNPLRNPIRGYKDCIKNIDQEQIISHYRDYFYPQNIVFSFAGDLDFDELNYFLEVNMAKYELRKGNIQCNAMKEIIKPGRVYVKRDLMLTHVFTAFPIPGFLFPKRHYFKALAKLLGEGSFSRLYKNLRGKNGLVYSVEANVLTFKEEGVFLIYTKCKSEDSKKVIEIIDKEIEIIKEEVVTDMELDFLKSSYSGGIARNFETALSVCSIYGIEEILTGEIVIFEEADKRFSSITVEDLRSTAKNYFSNPRRIVIGNVLEGEEVNGG